MPKISSQESVEAVKNIVKISGRMCVYIGVVEVHQISSLESVEAIKIEIFVHQISSLESVEAIKIEIFGLLRCPRSPARKVWRQLKIVLQERISEKG